MLKSRFFQSMAPMMCFGSCFPSLCMADASFERVVREMGTIGFAADVCHYKLTDGYSKIRQLGETGQAAEQFRGFYADGRRQGETIAAASGRDEFCSLMCITHGPDSINANVGRQSYVACP